MTPSADLLDRLRRVRLFALDVDGVLTDGRLYFQADGVEIKAFHTQDGHGLKLLKRAGISVALITGRDSPMVSQRAAALGIPHVFQGCENKLTTLRGLCQQLGLDLPQVAYCGDDLPDLASIKRAGVGITVPNAPDYMHTHADWVTERLGGHGAVREICDTLLDAQGHWGAVIDTYLHG
ncbi:KdsC family phosphatase [Vreelandella arcis]|uniref:3-deoxy-D-manno-octulosonate 8-phosphate phosphatase KdsC n=1 Tax=Vreelandella arcis TaxID=416873 RepID=A0A1G9ZIR5_9GAMM|nr:HAD hydrolase family protein [Halomonas arcis]SDN20901.1 3-deoxy-D-manno-octulosonate 8-phosphate phosphatase (KDO 8-P phosphatase) [Halomonas arcis]